MIEAKASPEGTSKLSKQQKYALAGIGLALLLIFAGVLLHLADPSRGEPLAPPPPVSFPSDVGEDEADMETIPPELFDEEGVDGDLAVPPTGAPL